MKPFQHPRLNPSRLIAQSGGLLLCLSLGLPGPAGAAGALPSQPRFADQVRVSRDVLSSTPVEAVETPSPSGSAGEGASLFRGVSTGALQFGTSSGVSLVPASVAHAGGAAGLGLKQSSTGSRWLSVWVAAVDSSWLPTPAYTLDRQGPEEFVIRDGLASGVTDAGSALSIHVVDLGSGIEWVHDGLSADVARWQTRGLSAHWALAPRVGLRAGLTEGRFQALASLSDLKNRSTDLTVSYRLGSAPNEGQLFLRFDRHSFQPDAANFESYGWLSGWSVNLGIALSAF